MHHDQHGEMRDRRAVSSFSFNMSRCGDRRNVSLDISHGIERWGHPETFRLSPFLSPFLSRLNEAMYYRTDIGD